MDIRYSRIGWEWIVFISKNNTLYHLLAATRRMRGFMKICSISTTRAVTTLKECQNVFTERFSAVKLLCLVQSHDQIEILNQVELWI